MASSSGSKSAVGPLKSLSRRVTMAQTMADPNADDSSAIDSELVPSSLAAIAPILRVANEVEKDNPRVAYIYGSNISWTGGFANLRPTCDIDLKRKKRRQNINLQEMIQEKPRNIIKISMRKTSRTANIQKTLEEMAKIYQIATVLYDVLATVVPAEKVDDETARYAIEVEEKKKTG
ncbi:putative callose synthase 6 [Camellia lanceoleosa]|uniref:Callose synthase 6 n=1 Tax=Camellia lanceoleosa TaxID=1840588 RepID=A0ACC0H6U2_9ERIC|nr:putative callose synthase 6 [Camellia lanceoleosa]